MFWYSTHCAPHSNQMLDEWQARRNSKTGITMIQFGKVTP